MSKSLGNVIDPLAMIEQYGCDALRFTLANYAAMGRDIKLSPARIEGFRHFANKLWNAARFALMHLGQERPTADLKDATSLPHRWILSRLETVKAEVATAITKYHFNDAAQTLYAFVWKEFCDWYLETIKPDLGGEDPAAKELVRTVLWTVLTETLLLLHPLMPFVTAEIWSVLPGAGQGPAADDIATQPYPAPRPEKADATAEADMALLQDAIVAVRNIRGELNISPAVVLSVLFRTADPAAAVTLRAYAHLVRQLARVDDVNVGADVTPPKASASAVVRGVEVFVPLVGAVDFDAELARMDKELAKLVKELEIVGRKLANEDFVGKAPAAVVDKEREKLAALREKQDKLTALRERLRGVLA